MLKSFSIEDLCVHRDREIVVRDTSTEVDPVYVDREKQIASFIRSGERLRAYRSSYEYPDGNVPDDVQPDPTSVVGFDLADASALQQKLLRKVAQVKPEESQGNAAEGVPGEKEENAE